MLRVLAFAPFGPVADPNRERAAILRSLGHTVDQVSTESFESCGRVERLGRRLRRDTWRFSRAAIERFNTAFLERVVQAKPDVVWTEKTVLLQSETIREARRLSPETMFVSWVDDNAFGLRQREIPLWRHFADSIPDYDLHFVKRERDVVEYRRRGAARVFLISIGFFSFHHPVAASDIPPHLRHDVLFVGSAIDRRPASIAHLLHAERLPVSVYGRGWNRYGVYYRHRAHFLGYLDGPAYSAAVCGSKIALGYVSDSNMDEYTTRSTDIPACGGFLLAQRTPAHLEMFDEGREAEFFGSDEECADKIRFYLPRDEARRKIARAGHRRALESDYSLRRYVSEAADEMVRVYAERRADGRVPSDREALNAR
jgi:hypothetical protein